MGVGVGIDYYFKNNFYFNSDIFFLGNITGNEYSYIYSTKNIINSTVSTIDFQLGNEYKKLKYEGGIQFNQTVCEIEYSKSNTFIEMEKSYLTQNKFGFALSAYYNLSNNINIGLSSYPSIMVFEDNVLSGNFSNIVFLELLFNIEAFSPRLKTIPQKFRKFNFLK